MLFLKFVYICFIGLFFWLINLRDKQIKIWNLKWVTTFN